MSASPHSALRLLLLLFVVVSNSTCTCAIDPPDFYASDQIQDGLPVYWLAQSFDEGGVVLDANNGFFDKGAFRAIDESPAPAWDKDLIKAHFQHLTPLAAASGSARWYIETKTPGQVIAQVHMVPTRNKNVGTWKLSLGNEHHELPAAMPTGQCRFRLNSAGRQTVAISFQGSGSPLLSRIELTGPAMKNARLLRARWRPAAIHTQYSCSTCPQTQMWVFESQSLTNFSSYSPISTQFGYFGGSFNSERRAVGNLNFSVWAASRSANKAPPLSQMPHLIATGNPRAEFGGFGHEGSGVKIREWEPLSHHPKSIIQALRVETADDTDTFSGYFYDDRKQRWILFGQARRPAKYSRSRKRGNAVFLRATSFCEIPGPPAVERTGDQKRLIRRRGWFYGEDNRWHMVDRQTTRVDQPANRSIATEDEWFLMATGGMEMVKSRTSVTIPKSNDLPDYLDPERTAQLFSTPVDFGTSSATNLSDTKAVIEYELEDAGTNAFGSLHYGTTDCLTFVTRELHATERKGVSSEIIAGERTWRDKSDSVRLNTGINRFDLKGLKPNTKYYYRLLVTNDQGKSWDSRSGSFQTR